MQTDKIRFDRADNGLHTDLNNFDPLHARSPDGRPCQRENLHPEKPTPTDSIPKGRVFRTRIVSR